MRIPKIFEKNDKKGEKKTKKSSKNADKLLNVNPFGRRKR